MKKYSKFRFGALAPVSSEFNKQKPKMPGEQVSRTHTQLIDLSLARMWAYVGDGLTWIEKLNPIA